jgi:import receptor subunit TOM70
VVLDTSKLTESSSASVWDRITNWVSENKAVVYTIAGVAVVVTGAGVVYYLNDSSKATPPAPKKSKNQRRKEKKKAEEEKAAAAKNGRCCRPNTMVLWLTRIQSLPRRQRSPPRSSPK